MNSLAFLMRMLFLAAAVAATTLAAFSSLAGAQEAADIPVAPVLRANVTVASDIVRIGDFVDNAGSAATIPVFRAPDIGTSGSLPTARILEALRAHQVIGVDTRDIAEVTVTRAARTIAAKDIEQMITLAIVRQNGLAESTVFAFNFDRATRTVQLDPATHGEPQAVYVKYDPRTSRFDVLFEISTTQSAAPARLRFTGAAVETVEVAVVNRNVERGEVLRASDVALERRPKSEASGDIATMAKSVGMAARRSLRPSQVIRFADLAKPELVLRDQNVTFVYDMPGVHLTMTGKAVDSGAEGDVVNVMNLQSKRVVQGVVTGPGRVALGVPRATATASLSSSEPAASDRAAE